MTGFLRQMGHQSVDLRFCYLVISVEIERKYGFYWVFGVPSNGENRAVPQFFRKSKSFDFYRYGKNVEVYKFGSNKAQFCFVGSLDFLLKIGRFFWALKNNRVFFFRVLRKKYRNIFTHSLLFTRFHATVISRKKIRNLFIDPKRRPSNAEKNSCVISNQLPNKIKNVQKSFFGACNKITLSEGEIWSKNVNFEGHIPTFRAQNTPKKRHDKSNNAQTYYNISRKTLKKS